VYVDMLFVVLHFFVHFQNICIVQMYVALVYHLT